MFKSKWFIFKSQLNIQSIKYSETEYFIGIQIERNHTDYFPVAVLPDSILSSLRMPIQEKRILNYFTNNLL